MPQHQRVSVCKLLRLFAYCLLLMATCARAATEAPRISLHHTSWLPKDGAPSYVTSLAQSPDGWLWVASSIGLYRFDGVQFEPFPAAGGQQLLYTDISSVRALGEDVWVGYRYGGATLIRQGRIVKHYPAGKDSLNGTTWDFVKDARGQLWAATARGLFALKEDAFHSVPVDLGSQLAVIQMLIDQRGGFWLRSPNSVYYSETGAAPFKLVADKLGWGGLLLQPDGSVAGNDHEAGGIRLWQPPLSGATAKDWRPSPGPTGQMTIDHAGRLWNLRPDGVEMLNPAAASQGLSFQQGLSGETGTALLVDKEGNVWVGTNGGLDRFRENKLTVYPAVPSQGQALPLAAGKNGEVWSDKQVFDSPDSPPVIYDKAAPTSTNFTVADFVDAQGRYWTQSFDSLSRIERTAEGFTRTVIPPPADLPQGGAIPGPGLGADSDGGIWAIFRANLYRYKDGAWQRDGGRKDLPKIGYTSIYGAPNGVLWFGTRKNLIFSLRGDKLLTYDEKDGVNIGAISQFYSDGPILWIGADSGLMFSDGRRFYKVQGADGQQFIGTTGIARSVDGDLWLNSGAGVFRIPLQQQKALLQNPAHKVSFAVLNHQDGLRGVAAQSAGPRSIVFARGKIWLATTSGVFWVDPAQTMLNKIKPTVVIKQLMANDVRYETQSDITLPAGTTRVRIDYTALSLTMPERMHFRYRLQGVDEYAQDAVNQRSAFYTGLGPGTYRFEVQASNNDGVWGDTGAVVTFSIEPAIVQTWWFKAGLLGILLLLVWGVHRLRLYHVAQQVRVKFEERLDERERIARELHDSLLQSVQAMILIISNAAHRLTSPQEKADIERALERAELAIQEGRDHVHALRQTDSPGELFDRLSAFGEQLAEQGECAFTPVLHGDRRRLHTIVGEEARAIGKEALANAFQHAQATRITVEVIYGAREFQLIVTDNGHGIPARVVADGGREGHWGLKGMHERARKINATLECQSTAESGTRWQLTLPARLAYAPGNADAK